jgi:hypothetical protein
MLYNATKRELLEGLIVAELISKRGQGPLARRHFPKGERGPASGVRSIGGRVRQLPGARPSAHAATADASDISARTPEPVRGPSEADDTPEHTDGNVPRAEADAARDDEPDEPG